ncbi:MAG: hypothetical protein WBV78_19065, partial [Roseobacter sp.]
HRHLRSLLPGFALGPTTGVPHLGQSTRSWSKTILTDRPLGSSGYVTNKLDTKLKAGQLLYFQDKSWRRTEL